MRKSKGMILSETQEGFFTARAQSSKEILIPEVKSNKFLAFLATFARHPAFTSLRPVIMSV